MVLSVPDYLLAWGLIIHVQEICDPQISIVYDKAVDNFQVQNLVLNKEKTHFGALNFAL